MDGDTWRRWVERFWFLRGIAAAVAVAQLVPAFVDLSRFEFLRACYALLIGWGDFASALAHQFNAFFPYLPKLSAEHLNAALFLAAIGVPVGFVEGRALVAGFARRGQTSGAMAALGVGLALLLFVVLNLIVCFIYLWLARADATHSTTSIVIAVLFGLVMTVFFGFVVKELPGYGRGLIACVLFVLTLQLLYWLNTPWLADQINGLTESALGATNGNGPTTQ